jgi:hypothetical protein
VSTVIVSKVIVSAVIVSTVIVSTIIPISKFYTDFKLGTFKQTNKVLCTDNPAHSTAAQANSEAANHKDTVTCPLD